MGKNLIGLAAAVAAALLMAGSAMAQSAVNYDESAVAPYTLEDPLRFADGRKVRSRAQWPERRNEILEIFQREMYGRMPGPGEGIFLETFDEGTTLAGFGTRRQVRMWFRPDKTGPKVDWLIVTPNHVKGPVPVIMLLNYYGNHEILPDPEILVTDSWMRERKEVVRGRLNGDGDDTVYPVGMLTARGYAVVTACYCDISPDPEKKHIVDGVRLQDTFAYTGIFDLWGPRDPARTDNTTSLAAWAWAEKQYNNDEAKVKDFVSDIRDLRTDHCSEGIGDVQFQCENGKGIRERDHPDSCVIRSGVNAADTGVQFLFLMNAMPEYSSFFS